MKSKRKLVYLPLVYSKDIVDGINEYFDKGYEIEGILNADEGCYILLILNNDDKNKYRSNLNKMDLPYNDKYNLIEENHTGSFKQDWISTNTQNIKPV